MAKHERLHKITFSRHRNHIQYLPWLILIRHSSRDRDSTEQTNPEKYNRPNQQLMNLATQLVVKEHLKYYLIPNFSTHSRREGTVTMIVLHCTGLHFLSNNYPPFSQHLTRLL